MERNSSDQRRSIRDTRKESNCSECTPRTLYHRSNGNDHKGISDSDISAHPCK
jgi:hypothetical protein